MFINFISANKLGKEYQNDVLVADMVHGRIYHFDLTQNRTDLLLQGPLIDKVADIEEEVTNTVIRRGFRV